MPKLEVELYRLADVLAPDVASAPNTGTHSIISGLLDLLEFAKLEVCEEDTNARQAIRQAASLLKDEMAVAECQTKAIAKGGLAGWQIRRVKEYIETRLGTPIAIEALSRTAVLSISHFARAFKISFGVSPHTYVMRCRLQKAQKLMMTTPLPLCEVALTSGFSDQSHLCHIFRRYCGISPAAWRRFASAGSENVATQDNV